MAIIGRRACPWCGFAGAHVKRSEGKLPYHHCPQCGTMTHAKNGHQADLMLRGMRPEPGTVPEPPAADRPIVVPVGTAEAAKPAPAAPARPKRRAGLWEQLMGPAGQEDDAA